jgi:hypothetical protein
MNYPLESLVQADDPGDKDKSDEARERHELREVKDV